MKEKKMINISVRLSDKAFDGVKVYKKSLPHQTPDSQIYRDFIIDRLIQEGVLAEEDLEDRTHHVSIVNPKIVEKQLIKEELLTKDEAASTRYKVILIKQ